MRNKRAQILKCLQWRGCRTLYSHYQESIGQIVWKVLSQDTPQMEVQHVLCNDCYCCRFLLTFCVPMSVSSCVKSIKTARPWTFLHYIHQSFLFASFYFVFYCVECVDEKGGAAGILLESLRACNHDIRLRAAQHIVIMGEGAVIPGECFFYRADVFVGVIDLPYFCLCCIRSIFLVILNWICSLPKLLLGICESICQQATRLSSQPEYAASLEKVVQKLSGQQLSLVPTVFERSTLAWVGGSLFASLKVTFYFIFTCWVKRCVLAFLLK